MKKLLALFTSLCLVFCFAGCGAEEPAEDAEAPEAAHEVNIGRLTLLNVDEQALNESVNANEELDEDLNSTEAAGSNLNFVFYNTLADMKLALTSGQIDAMRTGEATAAYVNAKDSQCVILENDPTNVAINYSMLLMADNQELCNDISLAIKDLKNSGELEKLTGAYINDCLDGTDPALSESETIEGAETITVAITGDLPPMDFINSNGDPAGFNVALMNAIGKIINKNIEFLVVDSGARGIALSNGKCDVVFWTATLGESASYAEIINDQPENTIITEPYYNEMMKTVQLAK